MSRIYLAGRYIRREEFAGYADDLRALGHVVDARWLLGAHQWDGAAAEVANAYEERGEHPDAYRFALDDVEDLTAADIVISFTERPRDVLTDADVLAALRRTGDDFDHGWLVYARLELTDELNRLAGKASRGGRHVEFGMAIALGKRAIVVGSQENVFHLLPGVEVYATWEACLDVLATVPA